MISMKKPVIEFNRMTTAEWVDWLGKFLRDEAETPDPASFGPEKCEGLIRLYGGLSAAAQERFAAAVVQCLESTGERRDRAERLFVLLHLVAYMQPLGAKRLVWRLLESKSLQGLVYAKQKLPLVALVAASQFGVDDDLLYYIDRSLSQVTEFRELLVYFRIASQAGAEVTLQFLDLLMEKVEPGVKAKQTARQLRGVAFGKGYRDLYRWYEGHRHTLAGTTQFNIMAEDVLPQTVPAPNEWVQESDNYAILLSALLFAGKIEYSTNEMFQFSRAVAKLGAEALDTAHLVTAIQNLGEYHVVDGEEDAGLLRIPMKTRRGLQLIRKKGSEYVARDVNETEAQELEQMKELLAQAEEQQYA
jgi:hypothetical protein